MAQIKASKSNKTIRKIVKETVRYFPTMGGGKHVAGNLIAQALKRGPPVFVTGTKVESVVRFVLSRVVSS